MHNIKNPKIGLLNIGEEEKKGNLVAQSTFQLMKNSKDFNFIGNVEGRDFFKNKADVIVCDGFSGNVILKPDGAAVVIDWTQIQVSDPRFDLGWTLLLVGAYTTDDVRETLEPFMIAS